MNTLRPSLVVLAVSLAAVAALPLRAAEGAPPAGEAHEKHTPLEEQMEKMGGAMRRLKNAISDPAKTPEALELVAKMKAAAAESRKLTPALAAEKPEAERAAFVAGFRKGIDELAAKFDTIEAALKAGDLAAAKQSFDTLRDLQKAGHKEYKKPDEKRPAPAAAPKN